jgi:hypothetical protein
VRERSREGQIDDAETSEEEWYSVIDDGDDGRMDEL